MSSYDQNHTENHCDKCGRGVGELNLAAVHFLYLDKNDRAHPDQGGGYRQYYICKNCLKWGV